MGRKIERRKKKSTKENKHLSILERLRPGNDNGFLHHQHTHTTEEMEKDKEKSKKKMCTQYPYSRT